MKARWKNVALAWMVLVGLVDVGAYGQSTKPATMPAPVSATQRMDRHTYLTKQLSGAEAFIQAINQALGRAGDKVAAAAAKAAEMDSRNDLRNRKSGGPIPWSEFYGQTASASAARPDQLNYLYQANTEQIQLAFHEIEKLGPHVDLLLARRRASESEQSALWAKMVFESLAERGIAQNPLYCFQLKASPATPGDHRPDGARVTILRASILLLRTADNAAAFLSEKLQPSQDAPEFQGVVYHALYDVLQKPNKSFLVEATNFTAMDGIDAADKQQVKDFAAFAKNMQNSCKSLAEGYDTALSRDKAGNELGKLEMRATLQQSLLGFAEATRQMDDSLTKLAAAWEMKGQQGVTNPDAVADPVIGAGGGGALEPGGMAVALPATGQEAPHGEKAGGNSAGAKSQTAVAGNLMVLFKGDMLNVYVNGEKKLTGVPEINNAVLYSVALHLKPGDFVVLRARSRYSYRGVYYAFITENEDLSFSGNPNEVVIRAVAKAEAPVPGKPFEAPIGQKGLADPGEKAKWKGAKPPADADWIQLPDTNTIYEIGFTVPTK